MAAVYDHLAVSLAEFRLDIAPEAIGAEAFVIDGKHYAYWGPFPDVLRMPLLLLPEDVWIGKTARIYSWLAAMLSVIATLGILREICLSFDKKERLSRFTVGYISSIALGSHLPYLLAGPSIYHEAVLWGAATSTWALAMALRFHRTKQFRWLVGATLLAMTSASTRVTAGYGALIGIMILLAWETWHRRKIGGANWRTWSRNRAPLISALILIGISLPLFLVSHASERGSNYRMTNTSPLLIGASKLLKMAIFYRLILSPTLRRISIPTKSVFGRGFPTFI